MQDKLSILILNTKNLLRRLETIKEKMKKLPMSNKKISNKMNILKALIIRCRKPLTTFYNSVGKTEIIVKEIEDALNNKIKKHN